MFAMGLYTMEVGRQNTLMDRNDARGMLATLMRTALPWPFSMRAKFKRLLENPKLPIIRRLAKAEMGELASSRARQRDLRYAEARSF
jgi:hypothetical protein